MKKNVFTRNIIKWKHFRIAWLKMKNNCLLKDSSNKRSLLLNHSIRIEFNLICSKHTSIHIYKMIAMSRATRHKQTYAHKLYVTIFADNKLINLKGAHLC